MRWFLCFAVLLSPSLITASAQAQGVVIYRCTDAGGALTVQNDVPCPKGSQQQRRVMDTAPVTATPAPAYTPPPVPVVSAPNPASRLTTDVATTDAAIIAAADRLPPPILFECRTYNNERYLSDDGDPPQRCAPLRTTGLSGDPAMGAGQACEMTSDKCQRVPDESLCESWKQRLRESQSVQRFGRDANRANADSDVERIDRIVRDSTCGI